LPPRYNGSAGLLLAETISNPRLRVPDLNALAAATHEAGALFAVDNTFVSPYPAGRWNSASIW
jgi:cystathionine beta-lyase/cystathionine gamma-synthase